MAVFRKFKTVNIKVVFGTPRGTFLLGTTSFDVFCVKSVQSYRLQPYWKIQKRT